MSILQKNGMPLILVFLLILSSAVSQQVIYSEDFEGGAGTRIGKIKRYPMAPEIVRSDSTFPDAFPPPSGRYAVRAQDSAHQFYGLGSVVAGPVIDLNNTSQQYVAIEAKLYVAPSERFDANNVALIAINDVGSVETYYRFGYGNSNVYFHYFYGADFTESVYDPILGESLEVPGWHTFTMRFEGRNQVNLYVDGKKVMFSPVYMSDITRFQMGVLGWDRSAARPILADDFKVTLYSSPSSDIAPSFPTPVRTQPGLTPGTRVSIVPWYTDTNQAVQAAQASGKLFLVLFYASGHPRTQEIESKTLNNPMVQATINKFIPVKLDIKGNRPVADRYNIFKIPTLIVIDMQGRIYWEYRGVISPDDLNQSLARF